MSGTAPQGLGAAQGAPAQAQPQPAQPPPQSGGPPIALPQAPASAEMAADLSPQQLEQLSGAQGVEQADGSLALVVEDPTDIGIAPGAHDDNLAEVLDEDALQWIAEEIFDGIEVDSESVREHRAILTKGMDYLGLTVKRMDKPFAGSSGAVHPMLMIAAIRWTSTARAEMLPAGGPARCEVIGDSTPEIEAKARRKQDFLNFYLTAADEGYYDDFDRGNLILGLCGSIFRKVYRDPVTGQPRSRFVTPFNLLVSDDASDLQSAPRLTFEDEVTQAEMSRRMWSGYYRDIDLGQPAMADSQHNRDKTAAAKRTSDPRFAAYQIYETQVLLDIDHPDLCHKGEDGEPDGLPLPWMVTVEVGTRRVLRLERDWREGDPLFRRSETYAHYKFHPGLGFYGWGLIHMMAATTDTASVLWRQAINAVTLFSFPGGLRKKGAKPEDSSLTVGPGQWREIDTGGGDIQGAVMPMPYRDVPTSWAALIESVVSMGQALGNTTELQVGEGRQDAPVGTTVAMIEQAMRPEAATLQRCHTAQRKELRMLSRLFAEDEQAVYPYMVNGQKGRAMAADFGDADDIAPVSDPNIPTQVQRLARAQGKLQMAMQSNGLMNVKAALEDMLRTLGCSDQDIQRLMPPDNAIEPADPVTEFGRLLTGQKVKAGMQQSHQAHLMAHIGQLQIPGLPPQITQQLMAHCGEHLAMLYAAEFVAQSGLQFVPGQPLPPQIEMQVSAAVAAVSDAILAKIAPITGGANGDPAKMAELEVKRDELAFKREKLATDVAEGQRKTEAASRQDAMEAIRDQAEAAEAAREREFKAREIVSQVLLEHIKAGTSAQKIQGALHQAGLTAYQAQLGAQVAAHGTQQAQLATIQSGHGLEVAREATKQHAHKVSIAEQAAKKAAQPKPKTPTSKGKP